MGMGKRKIAYTLLLVGVTFVALLHTALAFVFETGLEDVGFLVAGLGVFGILFVNFALPERTEGDADPDPDPDEAEPSTD
ncbi:hypothetical protein ACFQE8_02380 [Salinirubellus sp. GCM10025818]|jgi:hypothetical protein|uniref:hypothetical protein n=1 Tax=Salinirubellus TaxID=2162630 RepID=UPI0030D49075